MNGFKGYSLVTPEHRGSFTLTHITCGILVNADFHIGLEALEGVGMPKKVIVVEDENNLLATLDYNLKSEGYEVLVASDGEAGLALARKEKPDLAILDVMLPKLSGLEICRLLRQESNARILLLTAKGEEIDKVLGLELGADDYVTKPFSMRELMVRVRNILRRTLKANDAEQPGENETIISGDLVIDLAGHIVCLGGKLLNVKPREFNLLTLLVANKGRAFTRDQILERLWGYDYIDDTRTVDVHIRWLREKIELNPATPNRITTIRGVGYRFDG